MKKLALLIIIFIFSLPVPLAHAAALVNINTADAVLLETLPGIGPTKAAAILGYIAENGPFASISDIQKVSGIGPITYANIESLIAVDGVNDPDPVAASSTSSILTTGSDASPSAPPESESAVFVDPGPDRTVVAGADTTYSANITDRSGAAYPEAQVHWTFGDGSGAVGMSVLKSYPLPGTYLVGVSATADGGSGNGELTVTVKDAQVSITSVSSSGITVENGDASDALDLSYWQLESGASTFTFPSGTELLPGGSVTFSPSITGLDGVTTASLLYPSGTVAATYDPGAAAALATQLSVAPAGSYQSTNVIAPANATQPARAPAAPTEASAAGAALPASVADAEGQIDGSSTASAAASEPLHLLDHLDSPWVLGVLGVLVISGGALMVL